MAVAVLILMLVSAVTFAAYGIPLYFYGRYIAKNHPNLWKQLGSPDLTTAQGPRRDRLSEWIGKMHYLKISDPIVVQRGNLLRKLQRFSITVFIVSIAFALGCVIFDKLISLA